MDDKLWQRHQALLFGLHLLTLYYTPFAAELDCKVNCQSTFFFLVIHDNLNLFL